MRSHLLIAAALSVGACEQSYVYTPTTTNATTAGLPSSRTEIPQEQPQGSVEIASYGVTKLKSEDATMRALHVRMVVANDGDDVPWTLDTSQQLIELPGAGQSRPMFVNSSYQQGGPMLTIARHQRQVIDLYYPLPQTMAKNSKLPRFDLHWQVTTPQRMVASSTVFDRVTEEPVDQYAYGYWWGGYGPYWWYDPFYPSLAFVHTYPYRYHQGPVVVSRFSGGYHATTHYSGGGGHATAGGGGHR